MASRNAMGFLGGFLEAANEDSKRRQLKQDKEVATRRTLMAKRKELMFVSKVKEYEKIRTLHASLDATPDPVAQQNILSQFHGVTGEAAKGKPINFKVPELGSDPRKQLDILEGQTSSKSSPLVTKLRKQIKNLGVALGWEEDKPAVAAPVSPQAPKAPKVPTAPRVSAPSQAELDAIHKPAAKAKKLKSTYDAKARKMIFTDEVEGTSFAVDVKDLKKPPEEEYRVTVTSIDPETGNTVKSIQNFINDPKTRTPTKVGEAVEIGVKAQRATGATPDLKQATEKEVNDNIGIFVGLGMDKDEAAEVTKSMIGYIRKLTNEVGDININPNDLRKQAIVMSMARDVPIENLTRETVAQAFTLPKLNAKGDFEGPEWDNLTALYARALADGSDNGTQIAVALWDLAESAKQ